MAEEQSVATLGAAIDAFLVRPDLASSSSRSYTQMLTRLALDLGLAVGDISTTQSMPSAGTSRTPE